jgi:uncharacterized protein YndB with AHSA1/START domain
MTSSQQAATSTITTPTDREIKVERVFDAPRDRVFAVYTDPQLIPSLLYTSPSPRDNPASRMPASA